MARWRTGLALLSGLHAVLMTRMGQRTAERWLPAVLSLGLSAISVFCGAALGAMGDLSTPYFYGIYTLSGLSLFFFVDLKTRVLLTALCTGSFIAGYFGFYPAYAAYDSLLVALKRRGILRETRELAADFLKRTQARFEAGSAPRLDVIQAQVGVAQAENDLIANERDVANAQASLNRTLGRIVGAPIAPVDSLEMPAPLPDSSSIDQIALTNRPELSIIQNQQVGARATTGLVKEFWLPDITFAMTRDYAAPGSPLFTTGIALPLPAFYWQHARGDIAQSQHIERELEATYRDTRAQVTQDVRSAYANASTAMRQVAFLRDELVPAAREAFRVSSTSYSLGGSSALEVLTARAALLQAESQLADALAAANTARADLDRALGLALPTPGTSNR
jgi:outer membrane protein TolC